MGGKKDERGRIYHPSLLMNGQSKCEALNADRRSAGSGNVLQAPGCRSVRGMGWASRGLDLPNQAALAIPGIVPAAVKAREVRFFHCP